MKLKQILIDLKQKLQGGEHNIQSFKGLLSEQERKKLQQASQVQREILIEDLKRLGKIELQRKIIVNWKEILLKFKELPK